MIVSRKLPPRSAGIYLRQSQTHDQSISIEMQEKLCRDLCAREGLEVTQVWSDVDISGTSTLNRPGLRAFRAAYERGEFEVGVAHAVSRFARNLIDGATIIDQMPIATVLEGVQDSSDGFTPYLHALLAQKQSKEIGKRWAEVRQHRNSKGLPASGGPRFGYSYHKGAEPSQTYVPDPEIAPHVQEMYRRYLQGQGFNTITEYLNARDVPTTRGGTWNVSKVYSYMDSGTAAGYFKAGEELVRGAWEGIISEETWTHYLRERKARKRVSSRVKGSSWELQGVAKCAKCGGPLSISKNNGVPYARCSRYKNAGPSVCTGVMYRVSGLTQQAWEQLAPRLEDWSSLLPDDSEERAAQEAEHSRLTAELEKVSEEQEKLVAGWVEGLLDSDGYRRAKAAQDARRASLEAEKDEVDVRLAELAPVVGLEEFVPAPGRRDWQIETDRAVWEVRQELGQWDSMSTRLEDMSPQERVRVYGRIWEGIYVSDDSVRFAWANGDETELHKLSARHKGVTMRNKTASGVHREVRQWAAEEGVTVGSGGSLSLDLIERWEAATGRDRSVSPTQGVRVSEWARSPEGQKALQEAGVMYSGKGRPPEGVRAIFEAAL